MLSNGIKLMVFYFLKEVDIIFSVYHFNRESVISTMRNNLLINCSNQTNFIRNVFHSKIPRSNLFSLSEDKV